MAAYERYSPSAQSTRAVGNGTKDNGSRHSLFCGTLTSHFLYIHTLLTTSYSLQRFRRHLQAADWQRWDRYARRVRTLDLDDRRSITRRTRLEPSVYDEIAKTSPRKELLSNLLGFAWWSVSAEQQRRSLVFMHENIKTLSLQFAHCLTQPLSAYVEKVLARCPHLTKLEVRSDTAMREIQTDVLSMVHRLPQLHSLVVPMYFLTSDVMAELSRVSDLESIEFSHPVEGGTGDRADSTLR